MAPLLSLVERKRTHKVEDNKGRASGESLKENRQQWRTVNGDQLLQQSRRLR
jgi:hypothetical protein